MGKIASGKSTVSSFIKKLRCNTLIIDADKVAKDIYSENESVLEKLREVFGGQIFEQDKKLNYSFLAKVVFSDRKELGKLNEIMFPLVKDKIEGIIKGNMDKDYVIVDAAALFDSGLDLICDYIIWVRANKDRRKVFLKEKNRGFSNDEINLRIEGQYINVKPSRVDFIINNNGSLEELYRKVGEILKKIENGRKNF